MSTQVDAIALCKHIELVCKKHDFHVALTGGCLYGEHAKFDVEQKFHREIRKDIDIIFYSTRQADPNTLKNRRAPLLMALQTELNIMHDKQHGWMDKAHLGEHKIDMMFPEYSGKSAYIEATDGDK